jgi:hypothetical protein
VTLALDGTASARASASVAGATWLIEIDFSSGLQRYTTWPDTIISGGNTWLGLGQLAEVGLFSESENASAEKLTLSASVVSTAMLAACIGPASVYRGRAVRLYLQLISDTFQPAGAAVARWAGYMNQIRIERSGPGIGGGANVGKISIDCTRAGMARARNAEGLRRTHAQQQSRYPGDLGLEYTQSLIETPALWLSKRFQQK